MGKFQTTAKLPERIGENISRRYMKSGEDLERWGHLKGYWTI